MAFVEQDIASIGGGGRGYGYPVPVATGGGFGGEGSSFGCWGVLLAVIILWLLFSRDRDGKNGYGDGIENSFNRFGGFGGNCNSNYDCKIKMTPDMSNCEVDKDLWKVDADIWKANCKTQKVVTEGDQKILDKLCASETQALRDKLAEAYSEKATLESKFFTEKKFDQLSAQLCKYDNQNDKQYYKLDNKIDMLICETPKRAPIYACGTTPDVHNIDCHDFPRRAFKDCNECC